MRLETLGAMALCTQLGGCFVFIPGSVVGKISDTFTGDKGEHCVSRVTKVGDKVRDPYSNKVYEVTSLSGTSSRCNNPDIPIRAELALLPDRAETLAAISTPPPPPPEPKPATEADKAAACAKMAAVKPGAPQAEFQAAWAGLSKLGMTWRDCK